MYLTYIVPQLAQICIVKTETAFTNVVNIHKLTGNKQMIILFLYCKKKCSNRLTDIGNKPLFIAEVVEWLTLSTAVCEVAGSISAIIRTCFQRNISGLTSPMYGYQESFGYFRYFSQFKWFQGRIAGWLLKLDKYLPYYSYNSMSLYIC